MLLIHTLRRILGWPASSRPPGPGQGDPFAVLRFRPTWDRFARALSLVRLRPFDVATADGRSRERYRRVMLSGLATGVARGTTVLTLFVAVPLMLRHLGQERYGLWATLSSVASLVSFADLGLGSGLMNAVARAHATNERETISRSISSAFFLLCGIALLVALLFGLAFGHVPWPRVFNVSSDVAVRESGGATAVFVLCFLMSMPLGVVQRTHAGYQESFLASLWQGAGSLLGLGGLLLAIQLRAGLPWLVLALAGAPAVAATANGLWLFRSRRPWLSPRPSRVDFRTIKQLLHTGSLFFVLQLCAAVSYQSATLIIAQLMGARYVPQYTVPMTLFQLSPWVLSLVMTPLWPAYAEAVAIGDFAWIRKSFHRSIRWALSLNLPYAILLILFGSQIVRAWAGSGVQPERFLLVTMGVWTILNSFNGPLAMLLNGLMVVRFQVICSTLMTVANVVLAIVLTARIGVAGAVLAMVIAQVMFILLPCAVYVPKLLATMRVPGQANT